MTSKVVIVTGANSGIGFEVTRILCEKGHEVILACRNEERAKRAIEKIKRQAPEAQAAYMQLDLASLESVRKFVDEFHSAGKKLSILINNAGLSLGHKDTKRQYTKDNFELVMGTNHLGHFLLTNLLLDDLKKTASGEEGGDARIVVLTSSLHDPEHAKKRFGNIQPLEFDNFFLFNDGTYNGFQAYKNSKLANLMFAYELSRQLSGTGVKVNAVCPGFVPSTEIMRSASNTQKFFCRYILHGMLRFTKTTRSVQQAANSVISLALDEQFKDVSGKFYKDGQEVKSSEESLDEEKQKRLWQLSGGYTRLEGFDPIEVPPPPVAEEKQEEVAEINGETAKDGEDKKGESKDETKPEGEARTTESENKEAEEKSKTAEDKEEEEKKEDEKKEENKDEEKKEEIKKEEMKKEEEKKEEKNEEKKEDVEKSNETEKAPSEGKEAESKTEEEKEHNEAEGKTPETSEKAEATTNGAEKAGETSESAAEKKPSEE